MTTVDGRDQQDARGAAELYAAELRNLGQLQASEQHRERLLGYSKLLIAAATIGAAIFLPRHAVALAWLAPPVAAFLVLAVLQEKLLASIRYRTRAIAFYERGLARLNDQWAGSGETGERFLDPSHPYARDLDLFGRASLFEYLSSARTRAGEEKLAQWLLAPAPPEEVLARQDAVRELQARVKFRERLFSTGETVRLGVHPEALSAWGEASPIFSHTNVRFLVSVLAILWILSLVGWALWDLPVLALLMTVLNFAYAHRLHARLEKAAAALENATQDLQLLAEVLRLFEQEQLSSPRLLALQAGIAARWTHSIRMPSANWRGLWICFESRHSLFAKPLDLVTFWSAQLVFVAERWQRKFGPAIRGWIEAVGELEALTSLSAFAYEHPRHVFPEFAGAAPLFDAQGLAHPLLPADKAVENDVKLGEPIRLIILSGPNMAGKSTFHSLHRRQRGAGPVWSTGARAEPPHVAAYGGGIHLHSRLAYRRHVPLLRGDSPAQADRRFGATPGTGTYSCLMSFSPAPILTTASSEPNLSLSIFSSMRRSA